MTLHAKDPASVLDYSFDWSAWLISGEAVTSANWRIEPLGEGAPTLERPVGTGPRRGIHVAGGVAGKRYRLTCKIETDAGRIGERSLSLYVTER